MSPFDDKPLQTPVVATLPAINISHSDRVLLVGSCFTEHIGRRLAFHGFRINQNPFGILYNPESIAVCINRCSRKQLLTKNELVEHNHLWYSPLHHGIFSAPTADECLSACNNQLVEAHTFIHQATTAILTLGTAFVYRWLANGQTVGNCHKIPASQFNRHMLSVEEAAQALSLSIAAMPANITKIIITVSPIRHRADGFTANQLSKSTLLLAVNKVLTQSTERTVCYFPSYEIMMDELRDYRFYEADMLHPSAQAIDIIYHRFAHAAMTEETIALCEKVEALQRLSQHRPLQPESTDYKKHLEKVDAMRANVEQLLGYPIPDVSC